ncbi:MAG TPA: YdhR family protein [Flavisolibacter sp.]|nr:YdhR family protein [Flavisolibacter sp.]
MQQQILQVNFTFDVTRNEYEQIVSPLAADFARVPGLRWKIWLMNENKNEAGGIYLFDDERSTEEFKESPLVAAVLSHPALANFNIKQFDVLEEVSAVTNAPLATATAG